MLASSFLFIYSKKKKKYRPPYGFYKNVSGAVLVETAFVIPMIFFLLGAIFMMSMDYMKYRSMDLVAGDIARRYLYTKLAASKGLRDPEALRAQLCSHSTYIMLKCADIKIYIDAYDHGKFADVTRAPGLQPIFNGNILKAPWFNKNNTASFVTDYFQDNADNIFIVRIGYPGVKYVGVSITQGQ